MTDPLEQLRRPASPAEPRPEFVDALRQRVVKLLDVDGRFQVSTASPPAPSDSQPTVVIPLNELVSSTQPRVTTRRRVAVLAVAAVVTVVVAAGLLTRNGGQSPKVVTDPLTTIEPSTSTSVGNTNPSDLPVAQTFAQVGGQSFTTTQHPWLQAVAGDSLWLLHQSGPIERRNKRTGAVLGSVPVEVGPVASTPVEGFGSLWVSVASRGVVARIDLSTGSVIGEISIPGGLTMNGGIDYLSDLVIAEGGVWTLTARPNRTLVRIDPATNTVTKTLPIGSATDVAYGAGSFWVAQSTTLLRISPVDGAEIARIEVTPVGALVKFFAGQVWVLGDNSDRMRLARVDPATNRVVADFAVSTRAHGEYDLAFGGGFVWLGAVDAAVVKVDPETNTVVARYGEGVPFSGIAADDEAVWFSTASGQLFRLPLK